MERKFPSIFNNIPRHEVAEENKKYLQQFLEVSRENMSNKFCDLKAYECFKKILPLGNNLRKHLEYRCEIIDITISDDEVENNEQLLNLENDNEDIEIKNLNQTTVDDIVFSIKESLETDKNISLPVLNNLQSSYMNIDDVFSILADKLNHEEVINLGSSIKEVTLINELVISYYIRYLLIREMHHEYSDEIQDIINSFAIKYEESVQEEISQGLLNQEKPPNKVMLQFLHGANADFKKKLLKHFISKCDELKESHIGTVDVLLNNQVDSDCINILVELMSNSAITLCSDKNFGKLVMNALKVLGRNVHLFESSLKHIINSHRSIWKSKMSQILQAALQESFSITQSFRY